MRTRSKRAAAELADGPKPKRQCYAEEASESESEEEEEEDVVDECRESHQSEESQKDDNDTDSDDDPVFKAHVEAAKYFILQSFDSTNVYGDKASEMLDRLQDTRWIADHDVLVAAISCNVNPKRFVGTDLISNIEFLARAFKRRSTLAQAKELWALLDEGTRKNALVAVAAMSRGTGDQAKEFWELLDKATRRDARVALAAMSRTSSIKQAKEFWELIDEATQKDSRVAFEALSRGVPFSKLPPSVKQNRSSLLKGLKNKCFQWKQLPMKYKKSMDFALAARDNENVSFCDVLKVVADKDKLWLEWACKHPKRRDSSHWRVGQVPAFVTTDRELMHNVIQEIPSVANIMDPSLAGIKDYVVSLLDSNPKTLQHFPETTFNQCPEILSLQAIKNYTKAGGTHYNLEKVVPSQFWADHQFVLEWLSTGGSMHRGMPESIKTSKDIFRAVAKRPAYNSFNFMSRGLKEDKEFVLEILESTDASDLFDNIDSSLRVDEDVVMAACARSTAGVFRSYYRDNRCDQTQFQDKVKAKMRTFEGFFKGILCGVTAKSGCALQLLDQGDSAIQRNIASYLDFPVGKQLGHLVKAARNLNVDGFHPYEAE